MGDLKVLFINLGYARGIDGSLKQHIRYALRHFYCPPEAQKESLDLFRNLVAEHRPDLCCLVEIDRGSFGTAQFNQLEHLAGGDYVFYDIENKYARDSFLRSFGPTSGKSNGFMARREYQFEKWHFSCGAKRLIYKIKIHDGLTLFFAHFALKKAIRARQILEAREHMKRIAGEVIFLGDFNILSGMGEIEPLLDNGRHVLVNRRDEPTFRFHRRHLVLDLCVGTPKIAERTGLRVVPQAYSDHAALVLDIRV